MERARSYFQLVLEPDLLSSTPPPPRKSCCLFLAELSEPRIVIVVGCVGLFINTGGMCMFGMCSYSMSTLYISKTWPRFTSILLVCKIVSSAYHSQRMHFVRRLKPKNPSPTGHGHSHGLPAWCNPFRSRAGPTCEHVRVCLDTPDCLLVSRVLFNGWCSQAGPGLDI